MPKYHAAFKQITSVSAYFEADNIEQAEEMAKNWERYNEIFGHQLDDERHEYEYVEEY